MARGLAEARQPLGSTEGVVAIGRVPVRPKIYHILHIDQLGSIVDDGRLLCDAVMVNRTGRGTTIGMSDIKQRRLTLPIDCHTGLHVGECVPFYFCPRSVMLYLLHRGNHPNLAYDGGQGPIVHLEADFGRTVEWAEENALRWAFTLSNAGAFYFESRRTVAQLDEINWPAVEATKWSGPGVSGSIKEGKQAEFLIEKFFPWHLIERIAVCDNPMAQQVANATRGAAHRPSVEIKRDWYY